jgi:N-acetylglucosaminyldiphosphoundecaprenol N-acetyl-beta-D-mannosaminyltransferase
VVETFTVVGTRFHACSGDAAVAIVEDWIAGGRDPHYVCLSNVHDVRLAQRRADVRRALAEAHLVLPDGMPIVWAGRLLGVRVPERVPGPAFMWKALTASVARGHRHFLYGPPQLMDGLASRLTEAVPGLRIAGLMAHSYDGLGPHEEQAMLDAINASGADYLWLGIGGERQLLWMHRYYRRLRIPAIAGVGAAFAFHAGVLPRAPRWMQTSGLEWLYRLLREPRRLWRRYLVVNPPFLFYFALQYLGLKRFGGGGT